ncbi:unnamed protein product [Prunus armeniaca]|uniref:Uncharacterized protein n=1 Tax=Prunus armeniaca TaxID=36596 RepID=A0A6J5W910_PRUAR|nr:unnamed protein product [Prunus armeniaca]
MYKFPASTLVSHAIILQPVIVQASFKTQKDLLVRSLTVIICGPLIRFSRLEVNTLRSTQMQVISLGIVDTTEPVPQISTSSMDV